MPTYIRPARVIVEQGGSGQAPVAAGVAGVAGVVAAALGIVAVVTAWWPVIAGGTVLAVAVTVLAVRALLRRTVHVWHSQVAPAPVRAQAFSAPRPCQIPAARPVRGIVLAKPKAIEAPRKGKNG